VACYATTVPRHQPRADFIVLAPDVPELRLIVEIKHGHFDREAATQQLESYMKGSKCPLGLLITPEHTWLLRDTYESVNPIREVAVYDTATLLGVHEIPDDEGDLEDLVGRWLDGLTSGATTGLTQEVRFDVARYVLPEVTEGRVASGSLT
jgi:hypothetical protein